MLYPMTTLWTKHQYAKCFGHWLVSHSECCKCAVRDECEKRTKSRADDKTQEMEGEDHGEYEEVIDPLDYILQSLSGRYEMEFDETEKKIKVYKFSKDGQGIATIGVAESGKIMVAVRGAKKILEKPKTIEEAEEILKEVLS